MNRIKRILLPTDFSQPADIARPHAFELARLYDAEVVSLHVRTIFSDDPNYLAKELDEVAEDDELIQKMHDMLSAHAIHHVSVRYRVVRNVSPAAGILEFLDDNHVDLVVMGTHGRSALTHFLLGSVTERIVRHAGCPVLTVGHMRKNYSPHYRRILVPFDFSEHSREAVRKGAALARQFEAELQVLYVLEQEVHPAYYDIWRETIDRALPQIQKDAEKALQEVLEREPIPMPKLYVRVGEGKAHQEIVQFADTHSVDLIVMATHGLSGLEHMLLGSTTERVIRTAHCPVLTFKLPISESNQQEPQS